MIALVAAPFHEASEPDRLRADRVIMSVAAAATMWLIGVQLVVLWIAAFLVHVPIIALAMFVPERRRQGRREPAASVQGSR